MDKQIEKITQNRGLIESICLGAFLKKLTSYKEYKVSVDDFIYEKTIFFFSLGKAMSERYTELDEHTVLSFVQNNKKTLNVYLGQVQDLTDLDKKIIRNEDGSIDYENNHFESEYDFMESDYYDMIEDDNASFEYIKQYAEVEQKELGDNIIMSIYRGERW